jgi:Ni,Fe-hydrogenase III large subunit
MKITHTEVPIADLSHKMRDFMHQHKGGRLGLLTSIDGGQLIALMLDPKDGSVEFWQSEIINSTYKSLTTMVPQAHWYERGLWDLFGIIPEGHPRLKHLLLHEQYEPEFRPLGNKPLAPGTVRSRQYQFLEVRGEGVYEIPVGPIHAGVIEPGHFRLSCFGETILNLEIRLGFVHRGVEKRMTEVPWQKGRFVAEAAASDTAAANALAHAVAVESLLGMEVPHLANVLRTLALEIERLAMHIIDVGGMGTDIGFTGISSSMGRLRGKALGLGQMISGSRFLRAYIMPGGVRKTNLAILSKVKQNVKELRQELKPVIAMFLDSQMAVERMQVARISHSLAEEFGLVGVAGRACGIEYDCRQSFRHGVYPKMAPPISVQTSGDILAREQVRVGEIWSSLDVIEKLLDEPTDGPFTAELPEKLPSNTAGAGIVEAFRGELIHVAVTDDNGNFRRYAIKDPSFNNWTAVSIAIRNNLIADFPLCNKSLALSYSGNDL